MEKNSTTKISFDSRKKYIEFNEIFNSIFYSPEQKQHREIAKKFVSRVKKEGSLNMDNKVWRRVCESFHLNPDDSKDKHIFYYSIRKLINAGILKRSGFTYTINYAFSERLQELSELWRTYGNRTGDDSDE